MPQTDPELDQESLRQNDLGYAALSGVGVVMVQPFLTAGPLDASATICVMAFAVAIPLLAALILLNRQETFRRRRSTSTLTSAAQIVAQVAAVIGLVAGFWHIWWIAGVVLVAAGGLAFVVHTFGYERLERGAR